MALVKLAGRLPDGEKNGLSDVRARLLADPHARVVAVVVLEVAEIERRVNEPGSDPEFTDIPVLRVVSVEPVTGSLEGRAKQLHAEAAIDRTGITPLFSSPGH